MKEIDPQMFITCRLCLQQTGSYQIVPLIQHQIKYCFDINVKPFDLLPQLICKECKQILSDYFATKQRFVELQNNFQRNHYLSEVKVTEDQNETNTQQDTVSSSQKNVDDNDSDFHVNLLALRRKKSRLSSASSDNRVQTRSASPVEDQRVKRKKRSKSKSRPKKDWEEFYRKHYKCIICNKECKKRYNLLNHLKSHNDIFEKHKCTFTRHCTVTLHKLDDKPNLTGMPNSIVFDENRIQVENVRSKYCVVFKQKQPLCSEDYDGCDRPSRTVSEYSDDGVVVTARNRKRCRLESASSNDTTVLNMQVDQDDAYDETSSNSGEKNKNDVQCINIDDSSNAGSATSAPSKSSETVSNVPNEADYKVIQNLVNMSHIRHLKKDSASKDIGSESHIKQKILNMGRKIVTKQGINCTGLLRFMEHQNLNIQWIQTTPVENSSDHRDKIYITMKLKDKQIDKKQQWTVVENHKSDSEYSEEETNQVTTAIDQLSGRNDVETEFKSKNILLNESPVANPKQLPKKMQQSLEVNVSGNDNSDLFADTDSFVVSEMCLPKITSTTSLAVRETPDEIVTEPVSNAIETPVVARIKVKPVSELMPENVVRNISQEVQLHNSNISSWVNAPSYPEPQNGLQNASLTGMVPLATNVTASNNIITVTHNNVASTNLLLLTETPIPDQMPSRSSKSSTEYVILDSPDLPNITTSNPIAYITDLLLLHHIIFLKANDPNVSDFACLIKFKIQYNQDQREQPVKFFITFSCSGKKFHLGVRPNAYGSNIDLSSLSASWQWEIINKIYDDHVADKILRNAQKIGPRVYDTTKLFLCLMKSITMRKL